MAQDFYTLLGSGIIKEDRPKINENFLTIASNFSGTAFPTNTVQIGQTCYRTDLGRTYRYVEQGVWQDISEEITVPIMTGATNEAAGEAGLVPTPKVGYQSRYLRGDGTWCEVDTEDKKVETTLQKNEVGYVTGTTSSSGTIGGLIFDTGVYLNTDEGSLSATTFKGALEGNAATATNATNATNAVNADVATQLGTSTVGGTAKGIYLSAGTATAMSATVGSGTKPVYLSSGTVTASSSTVGSGTKPVYLSSGTITVSGSTVGSDTKPVYLNSGTLTACKYSVNCETSSNCNCDCGNDSDSGGGE